ncbi:hypothetical protein CP061683_1021B, partial [Chlamydia psittaci 06-1683]
EFQSRTASHQSFPGLMTTNFWICAHNFIKRKVRRITDKSISWTRKGGK